MASLDQAMAKGIAGLSLWSSRNAKPVVAVVLLLTLVFGYGVTLITTNVDVADVLPRGDPNTEAAQNLTKNFRSTFTQQVTFQLHVDEGTDFSNWAADNAKLEHRDTAVLLGTEGDQFPTPYTVAPDPRNITDEVYVRAMEEMKHFIQTETDFDRTISISNIYALVNWTVAGGEDRATEEDFRLPGYKTRDEAQRYLVVDNVVKGALLDPVDAIASPSWTHGAMLFMPAANNDKDMRDLGESIIAARDKYVQAVANGETEFTVFGPENPPLLTVDLPVANAHSSALVEEDMAKLMPIIGLFIIICLFIAFRNGRAIAISFAALGVGVTWTYGTMGYMGIALNTLNMTIVPLIMGVGIDYAIHMINEFIEHKSKGSSDAESFSYAGERAGLAMFIATLTTVLGLIVMIVSPSLLMAQLGFLSAVAISAIYILTITFIPAALTLVGGSEKMGGSFTPSKTMPALARGVSKVRYLVLVLVVAITVGAYFSSTTLAPEAFGDPGKNYRPDDPIRQEHEQGLRWFYEMPEPDVKANILTFEGPSILTPQAIEYYRLIEANLKNKDRVIDDTLRTVPFFIETWLTVKGGPEGAGMDIVSGAIVDRDILPGGANQQVDNFPETEEEIVAEVNAMFNSPMRELASIIVNHPTNNMAAMTFSVRAETFEEAEEVWHQVWAAVDEANRQFGGSPPEGVHVAFVGNTATNYLFQESQLPWLSYMSYAATGILFLLVFAFTRNLKATIVATALAGLTSLWWLGILPFLDIGLAITLMLPVVFIFNIGTDYAVHIIWNQRQVGNSRTVFETTGKAILFSAITTAGAFAFFIAIQNVAVSRTMIATTASILVIFLATMLIIPVFYPVYHKGWKPPEKPSVAPSAPVSAIKRKKGQAIPAQKRPKT